MIKNADTIQVELQEKLDALAREFIETINARTEDVSNFLTISELEDLLSKTLENTKHEYLDKVRECLSNIDETQGIKLKKENMQKGG